MTDSIISNTELSVGRQSLNGVKVDSAAKLRARIKRDSYDDQSYAQVQQWTDQAGWCTIHEVDIRQCRIAAHSYGSAPRDQTWRTAMSLDLLDLLRYGLEFQQGISK